MLGKHDSKHVVADTAGNESSDQDIGVKQNFQNPEPQAFDALRRFPRKPA